MQTHSVKFAVYDIATIEATNAIVKQEIQKSSNLIQQLINECSSIKTGVEITDDIVNILHLTLKQNYI